MKIRRAEPADGPAFLTLVRALAEFEKLPPPDDAACQRLIDDAFSEPPKYELWVAELPNSSEEADGGVVAYAATVTTYSTFLARPSLYLEDIFVHPRARRRGVATAMITYLRDLAVERGCGRMEWMVLDWNRDAQALYERVGAKPLSDWIAMRIVL